MTVSEYNELLNSQKIILVDFYADWCAPCQKMKPYLEEIASEMQNKVTVIRIDVEKNKELCKELKIEALPVLMLYKNRKLDWSNVGYISKKEVQTHLN